MWIPARQRWPNTSSEPHKHSNIAGVLSPKSSGWFSYQHKFSLVFMFCPQSKQITQRLHTRQMRPIRDCVTGLWPMSEDFSRKKKYSLSSFLSALSGMRRMWMKVGSVRRSGDEMLWRRQICRNIWQNSFINYQHFLFTTNTHRHQNHYISGTHLEPCLDCRLKNHACLYKVGQRLMYCF